jgi:3-oxoacyl-[acyl-carrier-protein] synthase-3
MATTTIHGVRIAGIASAVPVASFSVHAFDGTFGADEITKISQSTGVENRHIADKLCCSDLSLAAARRLLKDLDWDPASVDGLIFVSQSPDFPMVPATSCTLHARLGLAKSCATFDVTLGCSGHIYGLWMAAGLIAGGGLNRVLVLAGDISTVGCSPLDRSTALIFGDAGSATALIKDSNASPMAFSLNTDGSGWKNLIIRSGLRGGALPSLRRSIDSKARRRKQLALGGRSLHGRDRGFCLYIARGVSTGEFGVVGGRMDQRPDGFLCFSSG